MGLWASKHGKSTLAALTCSHGHIGSRSRSLKIIFQSTSFKNICCASNKLFNRSTKRRRAWSLGWVMVKTLHFLLVTSGYAKIFHSACHLMSNILISWHIHMFFPCFWLQHQQFPDVEKTEDRLFANVPMAATSSFSHHFPMSCPWMLRPYPHCNAEGPTRERPMSRRHLAVCWFHQAVSSWQSEIIEIRIYQTKNEVKHRLHMLHLHFVA